MWLQPGVLPANGSGWIAEALGEALGEVNLVAPNEIEK